jgi:hypothetical protein
MHVSISAEVSGVKQPYSIPFSDLIPPSQNFMGKGGWVSNYKTFIKHQIGKKKQGNMRSRSKVIRDRR